MCALFSALVYSYSQTNKSAENGLTCIQIQSIFFKTSDFFQYMYISLPVVDILYTVLNKCFETAIFQKKPSSYTVCSDSILDELGELSLVCIVILFLQTPHVVSHMLAKDVIPVNLCTEFSTLTIVTRESLGTKAENIYKFINKITPSV